MKYADAKSFTVKLAKLFPGQVTDGQVSEIVKHFQTCERGAVEAAISEHHRTVKRLDWPSLATVCDQPEQPAVRGLTPVVGEGTWFDVRRRQNRQFEGRHDVEVALRVYRGWWVKSPQTDIWRRKLLSQCTTQLLGAAPLTEGGEHLDHAGAEEWALTIFGEVPFFKQCLEQIRDTVPLPFMPEGVSPTPAYVLS